MPQTRKPKWKEPTQRALDPDQAEPHRVPDNGPSAEDLYLKRKAEVTRQDHAQFSEYVREKSARDERLTVTVAEAARAR